MSFQGETKESFCSGFGYLYFDTFHFSHLYIVLNFSTFICHSEQSEESIFSVGWFIFCYVSFFPPLHCTKLSSCAHLCGGHFLLSVVTKGSKSTLSLIVPQVLKLPPYLFDLSFCKFHFCSPWLLLLHLFLSVI